MAAQQQNSKTTSAPLRDIGECSGRASGGWGIRRAIRIDLTNSKMKFRAAFTTVGVNGSGRNWAHLRTADLGMLPGVVVGEIAYGC